MTSKQTNDCSLQGCVKMVPIFNHLAPEQLAEVMEMISSTQQPAGTHLFHAGDQSDALYVIHTGKVRLYRLSDTGKEQLVRLLIPGDFTGELALFLESEHETYAKVMENAQICKIARSDLHKLLVRFPAIAIRLLNRLAERLEEAEQQTIRVATEKVEVRLIRFLAKLMPNGQNEATLQLPMTRKDLATYLGTSPETVSRILAKLEKEGWLKQQGQKKIKIKAIDQLL